MTAGRDPGRRTAGRGRADARRPCRAVGVCTSRRRRGRPRRSTTTLDGRQDVWVGLPPVGRAALPQQRQRHLHPRRLDGVAADQQPGRHPRTGTTAPSPTSTATACRTPTARPAATRATTSRARREGQRAVAADLTAGSFTEGGTQWGVGDSCGRGRFVTFLDANSDGWPDLFLGNETGRRVSDPCDNVANGYPNEESKLFLNTGGTGLVYAPRSTGSAPDPGSAAPSRSTTTVTAAPTCWPAGSATTRRGSTATTRHHVHAKSCAAARLRPRTSPTRPPETSTTTGGPDLFFASGNAARTGSTPGTARSATRSP